MRSVSVSEEAVLPELDSRYVNRIVGYNEYRRALEYLHTLVLKSNRQELEAINQFVKQFDEFAIYTNLSRRLQRAPTTLDERPKAAGDKFERRGLDWVMALARVELGAMLAGFTDQVKPFLAVHPTAFEMEAYQEFLADGLRTHYFALKNDPAMYNFAKGKVTDSQTLAYGRRVYVTLAMMESVLQLAGNTFSRQQLAQTSYWKKELDSLKEQVVGILAAKILAAQGPQRQAYEALVAGCPILVNGVRQETLSGTATIRQR